MRTIVSSVICSLFAASAVLAQCTIHVATYGNDANAGTASAPFATPRRAVEVAQAGSVICFHSGSYQITSYFALAKPVTLMSAPGEWGILWADNTIDSGATSVIEVGADNVTIQQLEIAGGSYYGIKVSPDVLGRAPANTRILGTKVHETGRDGIKTYQADGLVLEGNEIYNTGRRDSSNAEGIDVMASIPPASNPSGYGAVIRHNYIHNTATYGLYLKAGTQRALVDSNRIDQANGAGLALGQDSGQEYMRNGALFECIDCTAINNVITNTQYAGLMCSAGWNIRMENNTAFNVAITGQAALFSTVNHNNLGCGNGVFRNNALSVSSSRPLIHIVWQSGTLRFDYNGYYNTTGAPNFWWEGSSGYFYWNSLDKWQAGTAEDFNSFAAPLQLDGGLQPIAGSPLVDRGVAIADITTDIAGTVRPQGAAYDIGAYELGGSAPAPVTAPVTDPSTSTSTSPTPVAAATVTTMENGRIKAFRRAQKYTLQAAVTSAAGTVNGGSISFNVNSVAVGSAQVVNGAASLTYTFERAPAGTQYAVQAVFSGTDAFQASASNTATVTVVH